MKCYAVFVDLQKAFDTVNLKILFEKLSYHGIRSKKIIGPISFLTKKKQFLLKVH